MNTLHHLLFASTLANGVSRSRRERRWLMLSVIAPDADGLALWSREAWEHFHRTFGHNLFFAGLAVGSAALIGRTGRRMRLAAWTGVSVLGLHYGIDLATSGTFPMRPLWPLSSLDVSLGDAFDWWLRVPIQWALIVLAITLAVRTWRRHGRSALELFSWKLDDLAVGWLARMLAGKRCLSCGARAGFRCASCHGAVCGEHARFRKLEPACPDCMESSVVVAS